MSEYSALEQWLTSNAVVVFIIMSIGFAALVKLSLMVWAQHKKIEESEITRLVDRIEDLVEQIKFLFKSQDDHNEKLDNLTGRVGKVEKRLGEHFTRCNEREKVLTDIGDRQKAAIEKYDKAILRRSSDIMLHAHTERGE